MRSIALVALGFIALGILAVLSVAMDTRNLIVKGNQMIGSEINAAFFVFIALAILCWVFILNKICRTRWRFAVIGIFFVLFSFAYLRAGLASDYFIYRPDFRTTFSDSNWQEYAQFSVMTWIFLTLTIAGSIAALMNPVSRRIILICVILMLGIALVQILLFLGFSAVVNLLKF